MRDGEPRRPVRGYVSAYLKQPPRSLAEAERDLETSRLPATGDAHQPAPGEDGAGGERPVNGGRPRGDR